MSRPNNRNVWFLLVILAAIMGMIATGCSRSPLESSTTTDQPKLLQRSVSGVALSPGAELYAEAVISNATGGRLQLLDVTMDVPAGAVGNDTLFSIRIPDVNTFYNQFGTDGLVFATPVTVTMSYRDADLSGVNESSIRIAWFNPASGHYESMQCTVDKVAKTVTGQLNHFSAYALISD
jgi:hypothetical protein